MRMLAGVGGRLFVPDSGNNRESDTGFPAFIFGLTNRGDIHTHPTKRVAFTAFLTDGTRARRYSRML